MKAKIMKSRLLNLFVFTMLYTGIQLNAQDITQWGPDGFVKIENGSGGMMADLEPGDRFSRDHDQAGDIDGDGIVDLVIGARSDDDGAIDATTSLGMVSLASEIMMEMAFLILPLQRPHHPIEHCILSTLIVMVR